VTTTRQNEISQVERFLMLDLMIHPEMTLEEFHERHGITYDIPDRKDDE
jgi:hypothetical protein